MQDQFKILDINSHRAQREWIGTMKVELNPTVEKYRGKIGKLTYRVMYGKQTVMKTPDTPA
jgi:hypothetical protein